MATVTRLLPPRLLLGAGVLFLSIAACPFCLAEIPHADEPGSAPAGQPVKGLRTGDAVRDAFTDGSGRHAPALVFIEAQSFSMGSRPDAPGYRPNDFRHPVSLSAFAIGATEVTCAEFCEFLNEEGNRLDDGIPWILVERPDSCPVVEVDGAFVPREGYADRPVTTVSWNAARAYCRWLSAKTGRQYRLPTEAEWECAARAGTQTVWSWGDEFDPSRLQWSGSAIFPGETAPVGTYPPNAWGLHDMEGNVWEWVLDCVEDGFYHYSPEDNPLLFDDDCWTPGIRGGSFADGMDFCRPGYRVNTWWWGEYPGVGFRVARMPDDAPVDPRTRPRRRRGTTTGTGPPAP